MGQAQAEAHSFLLDHITTSAVKDWKAAAWILERRFPEDYNKDQVHRIEHTQGTEPLNFGVVWDAPIIIDHEESEDEPLQFPDRWSLSHRNGKNGTQE